MMAHIQLERLKHIEAYQFWSNMCDGSLDGESKQRVADFARVSTRSIEYWHQSFKWQERYEQQLRIAAGLEVDPNVVVPMTSDGYRRVIAKAISQFEEQLDIKKVRTDRVADFVKLVNLDRTIIGQPTSDGTNIVIISAIPRPGQELPSVEPEEKSAPTLQQIDDELKKLTQ